ncbi:MAG: hypothetical protein ACI9YH_000612 [Colwellia sp.]|jgi:hypothetical protein
MISNRITPSRRLVLSSNNLKQELKEELDNSNKNENLVIELSLNENYVLGYN